MASPQFEKLVDIIRSNKRPPGDHPVEKLRAGMERTSLPARRRRHRVGRRRRRRARRVGGDAGGRPGTGRALPARRRLRDGVAGRPTASWPATSPAPAAPGSCCSTTGWRRSTRCPAAIDDAVQAYRWLLEQGVDAGVDRRGRGLRRRRPHRGHAARAARRRRPDAGGRGVHLAVGRHHGRGGLDHEPRPSATRWCGTGDLAPLRRLVPRPGPTPARLVTGVRRPPGPAAAADPRGRRGDPARRLRPAGRAGDGGRGRRHARGVAGDVPRVARVRRAGARVDGGGGAGGAVPRSQLGAAAPASAGEPGRPIVVARRPDLVHRRGSHVRRSSAYSTPGSGRVASRLEVEHDVGQPLQLGGRVGGVDRAEHELRQAGVYVALEERAQRRRRRRGRCR